MKTTHISLTDAKQRLGELVKRSVYGGERFVIEFRGKPVAELHALAGDADTGSVEGPRLGMLSEASVAYDARETRWERGRRALEDLRELREMLRAKYGTFPDSAELIREMRDERERNF